jgi:hypothetical protein
MPILPGFIHAYPIFSNFFYILVSYENKKPLSSKGKGCFIRDYQFLLLFLYHDNDDKFHGKLNDGP